MRIQIMPHHFTALRSCGATALKRVFTQDECSLIAAEVRRYHCAPREMFTETGVFQNQSEAYGLERKGVIGYVVERLERELAHAFLVEQVCFDTPLCFNEIRVFCYPRSKAHEQYSISPHKDQSMFRSLIVNIVLCGEADFCVADDKTGTNTRVVSRTSGDVVLMVGSGCSLHDRPIHFVGPTNTEERLMLSLRCVDTLANHRTEGKAYEQA